MKRYEEEFQKSTERNRMSFIATLAVKELMETGSLTKDDLIQFVKKNAEEQKHPERADDLVAFISELDTKKYLAMFGWRIFDLKQFYEDRKKFRKEIHEQRVKANEEKIAKEREEREALKAKKKQQNSIPAQVQPPTPTPKRRVVVLKKKA